MWPTIVSPIFDSCLHTLVVFFFFSVCFLFVFCFYFCLHIRMFIETLVAMAIFF